MGFGVRGSVDGSILFDWSVCLCRFLRSYEIFQKVFMVMMLA